MKDLLKKILYKKKSKEIFLIDKNEHIDFVIDAVNDEDYLGIDTEFDWRNTYFPKLSLLQIDTNNKILLIDCIKISDLSFLKEILENKKRLNVFHSVRSDTTVLFSSLSITMTNVFDIQAAQQIIEGGEIKNYAAIVKSYLPISLKKTETNSNWLKRPFTNEQLDYAAKDVEFLVRIYRKQKKILLKLNLLDKAFKKSQKEANFGNQKLYIPRLKKLKKYSQLDKEIFMWREKLAERKNIPPSKIFKGIHIKSLTKNIKNESLDRKHLNKIFNNEKEMNNFIKEMKL